MTNEPGISAIRWDARGQEIFFRGASRREPPQIFSFDVGTHRLVQLTNDKFGALDYAQAGDTLAYIAVSKIGSSNDRIKASYPTALVSNFDWRGVVASDIDRYFIIYVLRNGILHRASDETLNDRPLLWISPSGKRIVTYQRGLNLSSVPNRGNGSSVRLSRNGVSVTRLDALNLLVIPSEVRWSTDERFAILSTAIGPSGCRISAEVLDVESDILRNVIVEDACRENAGYDLIIPRGNGEAVKATFHDLGARSPGYPNPINQTHASLQVKLQESMNSPPRILAAEGGREFSLLDARPELKGVRWSKTKTIEWSSPDGNHWIGGLSMPWSEKPTTHPLVIQLDDFNPRSFEADGEDEPYPGKQVLVAHGMAVLSMKWIPVGKDSVGTPREAPSVVAGIDSAIDLLSSLGYVDFRRVGLTGWSRTGVLAAYAVSHPGKHCLRAAVIADGVIQPNYVSSLIYPLINEATSRNTEEWREEWFDGRSIWQDPNLWLHTAPAFNAHRVSGSVLIQTMGTQNLIGSVEFYSALRSNDKPVEYMLFPTGEHSLKKPREREVAISSLVDWMSFWLIDAEDTDPQKRPMYARWRAMKNKLPTCH
jgi:hypothetical protein